MSSKQKTKTEIKKIVWLLLLIALIGIYKNHIQLFAEAKAPYARQWFLPQNPDKKQMTISDKITWYAQRNNIDINEALEVLWCESRHNPDAKNWQGSTARGISQFIFKTWDNYCRGDVYDVDDNLKCFFKYYPKHKSWWKCADLLGYN